MMVCLHCEAIGSRSVKHKRGCPLAPPLQSFLMSIMSWAIFAFLLLCVIAAVATLTHETVKMLLETFK
jgi:hypothetical protein